MNFFFIKQNIARKYEKIIYYFRFSRYWQPSMGFDGGPSYYNRLHRRFVTLRDAPQPPFPRPIPKPGKSPWERGCNHHREHTISVLSVVVAIKLPKKKMKMRMGWMEC